MNFTTGQKTAGIAAIAAIIGGMTVAATQLTDCLGKSPTDPTPEVSSSPTPSISPSPLPSVTPSPSALPSPSISPSPISSSTPSPLPSSTPVGQLVLKGVVGETVSAIYTPSVNAPVPAGVRAYEILTVTTTGAPSYKGARVGPWEDPLKPVSSLMSGKRHWIEKTLTEVGTSSSGFLTTVTKAGNAFSLPPMYMELQFNQVAKAHGIPDEGTTLGQRCALVLEYIKLLRAHGVEPIKQHILVNPTMKDGKLDLDGFYPTLGCSFRQLVLDGALFPPMIMTWSPSASDALIAAVKATPLPTDSWAYNWDEGEPSMDAQSLAQAKRYKLSGLKLLQTHRYASEFAPYIDWFCPVVNFAPFSGPTPGCAYTSCMAQGNCQPQTLSSVAPATGHPMMVLDAPTGHAIAFPLLLAKLGVPRGLYFNSTQTLPTAWNPGGQYSEGGHGDGNELYAGTDGHPWPSLRLKRYLKGAQLAAIYLKRGMQNPVTGPTTFPQDEAAYETARLAAWEALP